MALFKPSRFSLTTLVCALFLCWIFWALWSPSALVHLREPASPPSEPITHPKVPIASASPALPTPEAVSPPVEPPVATTKEGCRDLPGASDVVIVYKTGASEVYEKLPVHLFTLLECAPNSLILSDVEHNISSYQIHDILKTVSPEIKEKQPEFASYKQLGEAYRNVQDLSKLKGSKAWDLDKWKFLPMVKKAYDMYEDKKWFLFVEADTAILWPNLLLWLSRLDPKKLIYAGSQNSQMGITFAHGGSGILVSHAAAAKFAAAYPEKKEAWEKDVQGLCCGDVALAKVFLDVGVEMTPAFPLLQGEAPMTIDWNDRHMCTPSVTWHHVNARDIDGLWALQKRWGEEHGWQKPLNFYQIFDEYSKSYIRDRRDEWNNISEDWKYNKGMETSRDGKEMSEVEKKSFESYDNCKEACTENKDCLQFKWKTDECALGRDIRVGRSEEHMSSGWMRDRIKEFRDKFEGCAEKWGFDQ